MALVESLATPLVIGDVTIPNRVFLAPMSGVTDAVFRQRAHDHGAGLVISEMVASGELARGREDSARRIRRPEIDVHMVQIAGREAVWMAEAARIAVGEGADIVDINMGCPARKVTGGYSGSALMRDPDHALRLIEAVVAAVAVPVTLKTRLGWDEAMLNAPEIARRAEQAGVAMITIHGRTRCQFYKDKADWAAIAAVKDAVSVPLVANGDIFDLKDAAEALRLSGADAVMVGRAHYGAPWIAASIAAAAAGTKASNIPEGTAELSGYISMHYEEMLNLYGRDTGVRHARKHLGWYLDLHAGSVPQALRSTIMTSLDSGIVLNLLRQAFDCLTEAGAEEAA